MTGINTNTGFSIKSYIGGNSTLLNAGKTTNFIYKLENVNLESHQIESINSISTKHKLKDRIAKILSFNGTLVYEDMENPIFKNNLILIDSLLPEILAELIKLYYQSHLSSIKELVDKLEELNPLNFDNRFNHKFYTYKIRRFLTESALGMMPASVWTGVYDANGGYLIVREDGEVLCYHVYNKNDFEDYLFNNTKLETASSSRHKFGIIENCEDKSLIKLNLQIRFV